MSAPSQPEPGRPPRPVPGWLRGGVTLLTQAVVAVAGVLLGLLGSFHVAGRPEFLGGHWPVAVVVAVVGNLGLGLFAGWGLQGRSGPALVFLGWLVGVGIVMFGGSDDVVIGGAPGDWVPLGFLIAGAAAGVTAVAVSIRFTPPRGQPTAGPDPRSSLRAFGRR